MNDKQWNRLIFFVFFFVFSFVSAYRPYLVRTVCILSASSVSCPRRPCLVPSVTASVLSSVLTEKGLGLIARRRMIITSSLSFLSLNSFSTVALCVTATTELLARSRLYLLTSCRPHKFVALLWTDRSGLLSLSVRRSLSYTPVGTQVPLSSGSVGLAPFYDYLSSRSKDFRCKIV